MEEGIDMEKQSRIRNLPDRISIREAASKVYVVNKVNDPSIKKTLHVLTSMKKISMTFVL